MEAFLMRNTAARTTEKPLAPSQDEATVFRNLSALRALGDREMPVAVDAHGNPITRPLQEMVDEAIQVAGECFALADCLEACAAPAPEEPANG
jgi:hypothetical protein